MKLFGWAALFAGLVLLSQGPRLMMFFYNVGVLLFWVFAGAVVLWILTSSFRRGWAFDVLSGIVLSAVRW